MAIAGVASALGRDLAKPLAAGPAALHQMLAAALSGSLGPVVAAPKPSHVCQTLDSALPRVAAPRRVHALPPTAHATGPPRACQPRGEVASSAPAAPAESAAPADQRSALTLPPLASLSLGESAGSWTSGALSALLNPLLAVCDSPPIEAMRRAMSSPGAPRATQGAAPRRRRAEGDTARDSSAGAAAPQAGAGARFVTAPPERLAALRVLAARSAALDPARAASALGSLGLDDGAARAVRAAVTDEHLLQFGALLGEGGCEEALRALGAREAWGGGDALLGAADAGAATGDWERIVAERRDGIAYEAWRRPLRRGLYLYRTRAVLEGVRPADVRAFHLDDAARARWDEAATLVARVAPEEAAPEAPESCLQKYRSRFPRPMVGIAQGGFCGREGSWRMAAIMLVPGSHQQVDPPHCLDPMCLPPPMPCRPPASTTTRAASGTGRPTAAAMRCAATWSCPEVRRAGWMRVHRLALSVSVGRQGVGREGAG